MINLKINIKKVSSIYKKILKSWKIKSNKKKSKIKKENKLTMKSNKISSNKIKTIKIKSKHSNKNYKQLIKLKINKNNNIKIP